MVMWAVESVESVFDSGFDSGFKSVFGFNSAFGFESLFNSVLESVFNSVGFDDSLLDSASSVWLSPKIWDIIFAVPGVKTVGLGSLSVI